MEFLWIPVLIILSWALGYASGDRRAQRSLVRRIHEMAEDAQLNGYGEGYRRLMNLAELMEEIDL